MSQNNVTLIKRRKRDNTGESLGKGNPTSFGEHKRNEAADDLLGGDRLDRRTALRGTDFVAGAAVGRSERAERDIEEWHDRAFKAAEYGNVPMMPDDYTPNMTGGQATTGHRRTTRKTYEGAGVEVRTYSATAIRAYAKESGHKTFDIPASAVYPDGDVQGSLRVTPQGNGAWGVVGIGMDPKASAYVAEAVAAVLESRTPSVALGRVGDLMARRKKRFAQAGIVLESTHKSSFIGGAAFDEKAGIMYVKMQGKKTYMYRATIANFNTVKNAMSPGVIYNALKKKGSGRGGAVISCEKCGRVSPARVGHQCPSICGCKSPTCPLPHSYVPKAPRDLSGPAETFEQNTAMRRAAAGLPQIRKTPAQV